MKTRHLTCAALLALLGSAAAAATFVPLESKATYLHTFSDSPTPPGALALSLSDLGFAPGDRLLLQAVGAVDNGPGGDVYFRSIGVFSSSPVLLGNSLLNRVPGALDSDAPDFVTANTYFGGRVTDIAEDFMYDREVRKFTVPVGAQYLFVAIHDQLYHDNSDPNHDFGLLISAAPVPEPSSWALLLAGTAALLGWTRRRPVRPHDPEQDVARP